MLKVSSGGSKFDEPPTFQKFVNTSIKSNISKSLLSPQPPIRHHPNQVSWSEVLATAHVELNKLGGTFNEYTKFSLEQQEFWADDLVDS